MTGMNPFDAMVLALALLAIVSGFRSGLLRSLATIFAYVLAVAAAVALLPMAAPHFAPMLTPILKDTLNLPGIDTPGIGNAVVFFALVIVAGLILGILLRGCVSVAAGAQISIADRIGGAVLGAIRILFLAVLLVLIFERIIPAGQQPSFLAGSQLRPLLSAAAAAGLRTLPPGVEAQIEKLKRERGF
jgi:membrane protein required for colicin V production